MGGTLLQKCLRAHTSIKSPFHRAYCKTASRMEPSTLSRQCEEIKIKVPWGHIAGKWWGTKSVRPIVGLHGWQDNAGTFDTLAPLLPDHVGFLAIDYPGHGLSSRYPDGSDYTHMKYLYVLRLIMKDQNWDKISIIGHSLSSSLGFMFSALFPDKIDMLVGFDMLKPLVRPADSLADLLSRNMEGFIIANERNIENSEPPSYTYEECLERFYKGLGESVDKDKCFHIMDRNIKPSRKNPNQYYFNRDNRLRYGFGTVGQDLCVALAHRIKSTPHLFFKAKGSPYYEDEKNYFEILDILKKTNPNFEYYNIEGKHHLHLNEPEKVIGIVNEFINRHRPPSTCS